MQKEIRNMAVKRTAKPQCCANIGRWKSRKGKSGGSLFFLMQVPKGERKDE